MRSSVKINPHKMAKPICRLLKKVNHLKNREFLTWQICLLTQFTNLKFSRKFSNLQYSHETKSGFLRIRPHINRGHILNNNCLKLMPKWSNPVLAPVSLNIYS